MNGRVGYRFHPTDEELVNYFLKHKFYGHDILVDDDVHTIDICNFDPWDLPGFASQGSEDQVWFFFHRRKLKYKTTSNPPRYNRSTKSGKWKPTGKERLVKAKHTRMVIGIKRTLVFYRNATPKELKTNWVIHEYELKTTAHPDKMDLVLCKLKEKADDTSVCDEGELSGKEASHFKINPIEIPSSEVDQELLLESILGNRGANFNHPSVQQPQFHIDQGISIDDLMFTDNGSDGMTFQFENNESEEDPNEMADSFLLFSDEITSSEDYLGPSPSNHDAYNRQQTHLNHSSSPQSLRGVYLDDIRDVDTDAEIIYGSGKSLQFGASNLNNHAISKDYRQTRSVQALTETFPPSRYEQSGNVKNCDDILVMEASSADSATYGTEEIKCVGVVSKDTPVHVTQGLPRSKKISLDKRVAPGRSQIQGKFSATSQNKAKEARKQDTAVNLPRESPKESITVKTKKYQNMVSAKPSLKLRTDEMPGDEKTGSFIRLEKCVLSQRPTPLSVYIINVVVGLVLFIAASREVLILH